MFTSTTDQHSHAKVAWFQLLKAERNLGCIFAKNLKSQVFWEEFLEHVKLLTETKKVFVFQAIKDEGMSG